MDELMKELNEEDNPVNLDGDEKSMDTLSILFDQLLADGLVRDMEMKNDTIASYRITAKGVDYRGYVVTKKYEAQKEAVRVRNENLIARGSIVLAILTGGLLLIEFLKFLLDYVLL